ncbi:MAG: hypothetical protein V7K57_19060 [Nostoc sp.]|uniref:hypothetical protein n=1 Tax=Nostoc sp. TaxID=1180 RepID=UPI002FF87C64
MNYVLRESLPAPQINLVALKPFWPGEFQNFSPSAPSNNCSPASSVRAIATVNLNQDGRFSYNLGNLKADIA